jgi:tetratricopeptide (TPR) repeat protein
MSGTSVSAWRRSCAAALTALLIAAAPALGGDLTDRLIDDARDGRLDSFDFPTAALIASGVDNQCELEGWLDRYVTLRERLLQSLPTSDAQQGFEALHDLLHEQLLTGKYEASASDLRRTMASGDFNCLSSLVIYLDLCHECELPVQIWLARGHVFLRAAGDDGVIEIEPGTPEWNPRTTIRRNGPRQLAGLRQITPVELLGKFYYNRGVELLKEQHFSEGIERLRNSLDFDPSDTDARANFVAGLNNWAVDYLRTGRYDAAAELIEQGLFFDPAFAPLVANQQLVRIKRTGR